jgi:hypothetical protein
MVAAIPIIGHSAAVGFAFESGNMGSLLRFAVVIGFWQGKRILNSLIAIHGWSCNQGTTSVGPQQKN